MIAHQPAPETELDRLRRENRMLRDVLDETSTVALTDCQTDTLVLIDVFLDAWKRAPTCAEIAKHFKITRDAAYKRVQRLIEAGVLYDGIRLTKKGSNHLCAIRGIQQVYSAKNDVDHT